MIFKYFGTFSRAVLSITEITFASQKTLSWELVENVNEWWGFVIAIYKFVVGFAMLRLVGGVFLREVFAVTETDVELLLTQKRRLRAARERTVRAILQVSDDAVFSQSEFIDILSNPDFVKWLHSIGVDAGDPERFFKLAKSPDQDSLSLAELVQSAGRMNGAAKSFDTVCLLHEVIELRRQLQQPVIDAS